MLASELRTLTTYYPSTYYFFQTGKKGAKKQNRIRRKSRLDLLIQCRRATWPGWRWLRRSSRHRSTNGYEGRQQKKALERWIHFGQYLSSYSYVQCMHAHVVYLNFGKTWLLHRPLTKKFKMMSRRKGNLATCLNALTGDCVHRILLTRLRAAFNSKITVLKLFLISGPCHIKVRRRNNGSRG